MFADGDVRVPRMFADGDVRVPRMFADGDVRVPRKFADGDVRVPRKKFKKNGLLFFVGKGYNIFNILSLEEV